MTYDDWKTTDPDPHAYDERPEDEPTSCPRCAQLEAVIEDLRHDFEALAHDLDCAMEDIRTMRGWLDQERDQ